MAVCTDDLLLVNCYAAPVHDGSSQLFIAQSLEEILRSIHWTKGIVIGGDFNLEALALGVAGIQRSTSLHRMVQGYISFAAGHLEAVLGCSGTGGIFFQRLAIHSPIPPEVEWIPHNSNELLSVYLGRALGLAKEQGSYLTWRTGGGSCLGIVHSKMLDKNRHWLLFGIEKIYGPVAVQELLESLDWAVAKGKSSPWQFLGKPNAHADTLESNYQIEGDHGRTQYLRIVAHNRTNKAACAGMCMRLEPKIAETQMDTQETIIFPTLKDSPSHGKEKASKRRS